MQFHSCDTSCICDFPEEIRRSELDLEEIAPKQNPPSSPQHGLSPSFQRCRMESCCGREFHEPMHYLLFYEVDDDYVARRAQFRNVHLAKAWAASDRGELVLGGALANPADGAVLLFKGDSPEVAENFAKSDPYVLN